MNATAARIAALRAELLDLEQQQRDELLQRIVTAFPLGECFNAAQIWGQPELRAACKDAGIATVKQLGKWLRQCGTLDHIKRDGHGVIWASCK